MEKRYKRCLILLLDGLRPEMLAEMIASGDVERIPELMPHGGLAVSAFPSTTGPAYTPPLTGLFPGHAGLPGVRWFDRVEYGSRVFSARRFRSYVGAGAYRMNADLTPGTSGIFEYFDNPLSIFSAIFKGVNFFQNPAILRRIFYVATSYAIGDCGPFDRGGRRFLLNGVKGGSDLIFWASLSIDEYSHFLGPSHAKVAERLKWLDRTVGQAADILKRRGELEETLVIMFSDHGNTPTANHFDLDDFIESRGFKHLYYPRIWRNWVGAETCSMVSGNAMSNIYLKGPDGWSAPLKYSDLTGKFARLVEELRGQEGVDIIIARDGPERARVLGPRGESRVLGEADGRLSYKILSGDDPLGYGRSFGPLTSDEILEATFDSGYPDGPVQILQHFRTHRAGDLAVCASDGWDLRKAEYELHQHKSSHGGLCRDHLMVPLRSNHPIARRCLRTADVFPTVLKLCGKGDPGAVDGRDFSEA